MCSDEEELIRKNRDFALAIHDKYPDETKQFAFNKNCVLNRELKKDVSFNLPHEQFKHALAHLFGAKVRGENNGDS